MGNKNDCKTNLLPNSSHATKCDCITIDYEKNRLQQKSSAMTSTFTKNNRETNRLPRQFGCAKLYLHEQVMCTAIDCTQKSNQHQLQWTIRSNNCLKRSNGKKMIAHKIHCTKKKKTLPRQTLTHFGPKDFHIGSYGIDIKPHFFFVANRGGSPFQCPIDLTDSVNCRALFYI